MENETELTALEIASGIILGADSDEPPGLPIHRDPGAALDDVIRPALERPPCLVSFSGGRDSSAVLAAATDLARREGLRVPVPATIVVRTKEADESSWQERVVRHLGLQDWVKIEIRDELDLVGPIASNVLRRHGLLWPCNVHFHAPLIAEATGGSLLTGIGGDELFSAAPTRVSLLFAGRARPQLRDPLRIGFAFAPHRLRARVYARRLPMAFPWLRRQAQRRLTADWGAQAAAEPRSWREQIHWWRRLRAFKVGMRSLQRLAGAADVHITHPLAAPEFAAALTQAATELGPENRIAAMKLAFGELLPSSVLERPTKAQFDAVFWNRHSRAFVADRSADCFPREVTDLLDLGVLQSLWSSRTPPPQTFTLLQAAWLASLKSE
jgi:asparagine synthetase B (glutamine-hydrolysing)